MRKSKNNFFLIFFSLCAIRGFSSSVVLNSDVFPEIKKLSHSDLVFRQLTDSVAFNDKALVSSKYDFDDFIIEFYVYVPGKKETLFQICSAAGIPYDTVATLNRLSSISENISGRKIFIPSFKGLFIQEKPENSVEVLSARENPFVQENSFVFVLGGRVSCFFPGRRFSPTIRAFFLDASIRLPLDSAVISSGFGYRQSPVYGTWKFHKGVDFAAKEGSNVYACKKGVVISCIYDDRIFGNYIVLQHEGDFTSTYAHLSKINVKKNDMVMPGALIGMVGKTGAATGPHLHFEIRQKGVAENPMNYIR